MDAAQYLAAFRQLPAAVVADCMSRLPALSSDIRLMSAPKKPVMCGLAVTVKARSGDNLMLHKAMDMAKKTISLFCPMKATAVSL